MGGAWQQPQHCFTTAPFPQGLLENPAAPSSSSLPWHCCSRGFLMEKMKNEKMKKPFFFFPTRRWTQSDAPRAISCDLNVKCSLPSNLSLSTSVLVCFSTRSLGLGLESLCEFLPPWEVLGYKCQKDGKCLSHRIMESKDSLGLGVTLKLIPFHLPPSQAQSKLPLDTSRDAGTQRALAWELNVLLESG